MKGIRSVLLGGVPFGCDNVGDEAILSCVVRILRDLRPELELTASTADGAATSELLGIGTIPLLGFPDTDGAVTDPKRVREYLSGHDLYIWSGATGLSDYPHVAVPLLRAAQALGKQTAVFCTGMNRQLNPALFRLRPNGRKTRLMRLLGRLSLGTFDAVAAYDRHLDRSTRAGISRALSQADLVVLRDPESREELRRTPPATEVVLGADPAILLEPAPREAGVLPPEFERALELHPRRLGVCISAQRAVTNVEGLVSALDALHAAHADLGIYFLPMNPVTDAELMRDLRRRLRAPERSHLLPGRHQPETLALAAASMDVVLSSRLHLLILAANAGTPIVGIGRGSKVDNYLRPYGLRPVGETENLDVAALQSEVSRLLGPDGGLFRERAGVVQTELLERLDGARAALGRLLGPGGS